MESVRTKYIKYLDTPVGAKKYNDFKKILYGQPDSLVLHLFRSIYPRLKKIKSLKILDVGGGDGKRLRLLIDLFRKNGIEVSATLIEPSAVFIKNLKKSLSKRKKYKIRLAKCKFEDFKTQGKYDIVLFLHSIFTFRDAGYLKKAKRMLAKDGLMIIMSNDCTRP